MIDPKKRSQYKNNCIARYDKNVERYIETYKKDYKGYPSNKKRLDIMRELVRKHNPDRILYVGCGACVPMVTLIKEFGCNIEGIDFSEKMIKRGREVLKEHGLNPDLIRIGDIEDEATLPEGTFDFAIAAGVFAHLPDDDRALQNLNMKLKTDGILAVEFRNELFSMYSFNRFSYDFFFNSLLAHSNLEGELHEEAELFFKKNFEVPLRKSILPKSTHKQNDIIMKFHNPLNIGEMLGANGFVWQRNYFYHYHVLPPHFEKLDDDLYNKLSRSLEHPLDWRGNFMASAFVSEAKKHKFTGV